MRFKRRPNEIKPPPRSLVARGAGRLIRDFSSVAWYPCLDGKTVGQLSAGTTAARTISPAPRGGSKMTAPLPPRCYAAGFRGASESLSPQWRQLAKKRERADHGKTVPLPASPGYWCIRGWNRVWKQNGFLPAISSSSLDMEYRDKLQCRSLPCFERVDSWWRREACLKDVLWGCRVRHVVKILEDFCIIIIIIIGNGWFQTWFDKYWVWCILENSFVNSFLIFEIDEKDNGMRNLSIIVDIIGSHFFFFFLF